MYAYDEDRGTHHYIIVEIKYCRDTDPSQQQSRAEEQHQLLKQTIPACPLSHHCLLSLLLLLLSILLSNVVLK